MTSAGGGVGAAGAGGCGGAAWTDGVAGAEGFTSVGGGAGAAGAAGLAGSSLSEGSEGAGGACPATTLNGVSAARLAGLLTSRLTVPGWADALTVNRTSSCVALMRFEDSTWRAAETDET